MSSDPRDVLTGWLHERQGMAVNTAMYHQPLVLTVEQVQALLAFRICRASFETERGLVVHCQKPEGHDFMHQAGFSWEACSGYALRYNEKYRCIRLNEHRGNHDYGGWGVDYDDWKETGYG